MIPKKIHYIWLGGNPKCNLINMCILSWKDKMPDYEIIEWNEKNLDINKLRQENKFFNECYKRKMYAFMSDYIRLKVLYENGGIYFDTDIQVLKKFDDLLNNEFFIGRESSEYVGTGVIGAEKGNEIIKRALEVYEKEIWDKEIYTTPEILTYSIDESKGKKSTILSEEAFYPFALGKAFFSDCIKENTYTIHWWNASWTDKTYNAFLNTKHIKNPIKRKIIYFKKICGCYYRNIKRRFNGK